MAAIAVEEHDGRWIPTRFEVSTADTLKDAVAWFEERSRAQRIVAAGADTLTEWNSERAGWRPADLWLRQRYPAVRNGIIAPAALRGAMTLNGAGFLMLFRERFEDDSTVVTEAHPKVCFYALPGADLEQRRTWDAHQAEMADWLIGQIGVGVVEDILAGKADHRFDAGMCALAALRGLNGEWTLDLHDLPGADYSGRVRFCGKTHYWWPQFD